MAEKVPTMLSFDEGNKDAQMVSIPKLWKIHKASPEKRKLGSFISPLQAEGR